MIATRLEKNGRYWRAVWVDLHGVRHSEGLGPVKSRSRKAALRQCAEIALRLNTGAKQNGKAPRLGDFTARYLSLRTDLSEASMINHRLACKRLVQHFGAAAQLDRITRADAASFQASLANQTIISTARPISLYTRHKYTTLAKQIFEWAAREDSIPFNPFDRVKIIAPKIERDWRYVTDEETQRILDACPSLDWKILVSLCRFGGTRRGEALRLTRRCIESDRVVIVPEGDVATTKQASRVVPMERRLRIMVEMGVDAGIFPLRIRSDGIEDEFRKIIRRAGLAPWPKPFHTLRKNLATDWMAKYPPLDVARWLGHDVKVAANHYHQTRSESMALVTGVKPG